jgi:uncharacterized protein YfdQ (DUF2303 family)
MSDNNSAVVRDLTALSLSEREFGALGGEQGLLIPDGFRVELLDEYKSKPRRLHVSESFFSLPSFLAYVKKFGNESTEIFCRNQKNHLFTAKLDYHMPNSPSWVGHMAILQYHTTDEWECWMSRDCDKMSQRLFSEFLEDNAGNIAKPDLAVMLEQVKNVQVGGKSSSKSQIADDRDHVLSEQTTTIESGVPEIMELSLMPWKHSSPYLVRARVRVHLNDGERPKFSYQLIKPERIIEDLVQTYIDRVIAEDLNVYV